MKIIKREEAIEKIIKDELKIWKRKFRENDLSYFEDLIRNGGFLLGFEDLENEDLEQEYREKFNKEVQIR